MTYFIAKEVEFPIPEQRSSFSVDLAEDACKNTEFLQEQVLREIAQSKSCLVDEDCSTLYLGCPFGCRTVVNKSRTEKITALANLIRPECPTCVYRCLGGDFTETCDRGVCRAVKLGPNIQPKKPLTPNELLESAATRPGTL